ncbi:hypothetical protein D3C78_1500580 [compost metagenome]
MVGWSGGRLEGPISGRASSPHPVADVSLRTSTILVGCGFVTNTGVKRNGSRSDREQEGADGRLVLCAFVEEDAGWPKNVGGSGEIGRSMGNLR